MKLYHYFVSCLLSDGTYIMVDCSRLKKISSFDDIVKMRDFIAKKSNWDPCDLIILNYQLICDEPY